ncbi:alpha/beta fold hydrolase [Saccharopolyspora aridisoli]|uniref:Alpha/beta fold hydrolase n=1 Tax=Saccharopolyspora aridisoli TaxID=2530385 RepID=A0A4V2Y7G5_9PSEU|nr:alpha/beta hydrolase [Saccharopolyspora aridisoli]TDC91925.1 alpha/beta fold hydrolase [Saccharopolyspora aridisoli]
MLTEPRVQEEHVPIAQRGGLKIAYEVVGAGPPLVLHPGMFQTGAQWTRAGYTSVLATTHTVITVDPLGLGASSAPVTPADYSLARRAESVTAVLDDLGLGETAFWGYSLGALTGYAVALHAPDRLSCLVAGAFDPINGFRSAVEAMLDELGLPADTDPWPLMRQGARANPAYAAVIDAVAPEALRANYEAFRDEPGVHESLERATVPQLMYAGTADPWHDPMRTFATRTGTPFASIPDADHVRAWRNTAEVLSHAHPFLTREQDQG